MWWLYIHPVARQDVAAMLEFYPSYYHRIVAELDILCRLHDPRTAWHVEPLLKRWRGYYRLALYPEQTRVIFALYERERRIERWDAVSGVGGTIEVRVCRFRNDAYGCVDRIGRAA